jgi:hypothetical protein
MESIILKAIGDEVEDFLADSGFPHIQVRKRGQHLILFSEEQGEKVNHARLSVVDATTFGLSLANHLGKWEPAPFTDTPKGLVRLLIDQFPFTLTDR